MRVFLGILIATALCICPLLFLLTPSDDSATVATLFRRDMISNAWTATVDSCMGVLLRNTPRRPGWQVNRTPNGETITILVFSLDSLPVHSRLPRSIARRRGSCTSLGADNIIVCDGHFLRTFPQTHGLFRIIDAFPDPRQREVMRMRRQWMFLFRVLGHEVGHVLRGHARTHFVSNAYERVPLITSSALQLQELEADSVVAAVACTDSTLRFDMTRMLLDMLNEELAAKQKHQPFGVGVHYDYISTESIEYSTIGSHPEFLVRALRMLALIRDPVLEHGLTSQLNDVRSRIRPARRSAFRRAVDHILTVFHF